MLILNFLFYKLYKITLKTENSWGKAGRPVWTAIFIVSVLIFFNIISVAIIFSKTTNSSILPDSLSPISGIIVGIIFYVFGYFVFKKNKKYLEIEKRFDSFSKSKQKVWNIFFWSYIIITFSTIFIFIPMCFNPAISR